jgi:hypothetical protein
MENKKDQAGRHSEETMMLLRKGSCKELDLMQ